jgi:hypothetical protein
VHILDAFKDLSGKQGRALLGKSELFAHQVVQLAVDAQLLDQVNVLFIGKGCVKFDQVGVGHVKLQFDLPQKLVLHNFPFCGSPFIDITFFDYFHRTCKPCRLVNGQVYLTIFALAQEPDLVKVSCFWRRKFI